VAGPRDDTRNEASMDKRVAITGTRWTGWLFFGLKNRGKA
jgi:hypothetical protein